MRGGAAAQKTRCSSSPARRAGACGLPESSSREPTVLAVLVNGAGRRRYVRSHDFDSRKEGHGQGDSSPDGPGGKREGGASGAFGKATPAPRRKQATLSGGERSPQRSSALQMPGIQGREIMIPCRGARQAREAAAGGGANPPAGHPTRPPRTEKGSMANRNTCRAGPPCGARVNSSHCRTFVGLGKLIWPQKTNGALAFEWRGPTCHTSGDPTPQPYPPPSPVLPLLPPLPSRAQSCTAGRAPGARCSAAGGNGTSVQPARRPVATSVQRRQTPALPTLPAAGARAARATPAA